MEKSADKIADNEKAGSATSTPEKVWRPPLPKN